MATRIFLAMASSLIKEMSGEVLHADVEKDGIRRAHPVRICVYCNQEARPSFPGHSDPVLH